MTRANFLNVQNKKMSQQLWAFPVFICTRHLSRSCQLPPGDQAAGHCPRGAALQLLQLCGVELGTDRIPAGSLEPVWLSLGGSEGPVKHGFLQGLPKTVLFCSRGARSSDSPLSPAEHQGHRRGDQGQDGREAQDGTLGQSMCPSPWGMLHRHSGCQPLSCDSRSSLLQLPALWSQVEAWRDTRLLSPADAILPPAPHVTYRVTLGCRLAGCPRPLAVEQGEVCMDLDLEFAEL